MRERYRLRGIVSTAGTACMGRPTHQSESSGEIFDFLIDEAAELQLALCAFSRFLVL